MSRLSAVAALLMLGAVPLATTARAEMEHMDHHPMHYHAMTHHHHMREHRMHANGLCNGRSHGTGYHGCGTATGGPVGGLPNRN